MASLRQPKSSIDRRHQNRPASIPPYSSARPKNKLTTASCQLGSYHRQVYLSRLLRGTSVSPYCIQILLHLLSSCLVQCSSRRVPPFDDVILRTQLRWGRVKEGRVAKIDSPPTLSFASTIYRSRPVRLLACFPPTLVFSTFAIPPSADIAVKP